MIKQSISEDYFKFLHEFK